MPSQASSNPPATKAPAALKFIWVAHRVHHRCKYRHRGRLHRSSLDSRTLPLPVLVPVCGFGSDGNPASDVFGGPRHIRSLDDSDPGGIMPVHFALVDRFVRPGQMALCTYPSAEDAGGEAEYVLGREVHFLPCWAGYLQIGYGCGPISRSKLRYYSTSIIAVIHQMQLYTHSGPRTQRSPDYCAVLDTSPHQENGYSLPNSWNWYPESDASALEALW